MKRYYEYTETERTQLTDDLFYDAVKLEAISRGIKVPIPQAQALKNIGYVGFQIPPDALKLHEICTGEKYGGSKGTGLCFTTEEAAKAALVGAVLIYEDGYGATARTKISSAEPSIALRFIGGGSTKSFQARVEESDDFEVVPEFEALATECKEDCARIMQATYMSAVRAQKREEYLRLAQGNEQIAASFWAKVETGTFPTQ
jgi:hypothetical protein